MDTENTTEDPAGPAIVTPTIPPVVVECQELRERLARNTYKLGLMAAALGLTGEEEPDEIMARGRDHAKKLATAVGLHDANLRLSEENQRLRMAYQALKEHYAPSVTGSGAAVQEKAP